MTQTPQPYTPEVRFSDVDAYGIVHNAVYLVYLEEARIHWWRQVVGQAWNWHEVGVLVAHHDIDYLRPLKFGDAPSILCEVGKVGDKSIEVKYRVLTLGCKERGRQRDGPLNHGTGKGWVKQVKGHYV